MFKIRKKLKHHPVNLEESPMAQDMPQPPAEALTKRITIHADIPASLEVAGNIVMVFDKHVKHPNLIMPFDNLPLCLHLVNIIQNTVLNLAANKMREMQGEQPSRNGSGLWLPPGV